MTDDNESREPTERSANQTSRGLAVFFAVLICYALSPIPVASGLQRLGVMQHVEPVFETVYAPLEYVAEHVEFVGKFYLWQCNLFGL